LSTILPQVRTEIQRLQRNAALDHCISETNTTPITHLGNSLAENVVTPRLRDRFAEEIGKLAGHWVRVELVRAEGRYGAPHYRVQLIARPDADVAKVLSEGEHTCVALAGFLTELATAEHKSTLVFDDPVSSLDHKWRARVARRLVEEAEERQIVVFTHDIVFLHDLIDGAERRGIPFTLRQLHRTGSGVGVVEHGTPWKAMRVEQRLDELEKRARAARPYQESGDEDRYAKAVANIYNGLRATWERALEYVAFQRIVQRHRDYVETRNLKKVTVLTEHDCDAFHNNFGKCCTITDSHDPSAARNPVTPDPAEMLQDIAALGDWVRSLRSRQRTV
jgi:hypothetical protein